MERRAAADGVLKDVIAPPTDTDGGLFSEMNDHCVAILLIYGTAWSCSPPEDRGEEEYMAKGSYTRP